MLVVYCGTHIQKSRSEYRDFIDSYEEENYEVIHLSSTDYENIEAAVNAHASLFSTKTLFTGENILKYKMLRKNVKEFYTNHKDYSFIFWEEFLAKKDLSRSLKEANINDYSLPGSIWKLLDSLQPGKSRIVLRLIRDVHESTDEYMILYMMQKHIKDLVLIKRGQSTRKLASWQQGKLKSQASRWDETHLQSFFMKLHDVERNTKNGTLPYDILDAIDILITVYLQ